MGRHLASAGAGIVFRADGLEKSVEGRDTEHEAESAVAIVGVEPVHAGTQKKTGSGSDRFVTRARDLEVDFALALELDFAVVQPPREIHRAVQTDKRVTVQAVVLGRFQLGDLHASLYGHLLRPRDEKECPTRESQVYRMGLLNRQESGMPSPQTAVLYQVLKVLFGIGKSGVSGFDDGRGSALKGFLGWNALQPALPRELFVIRKVEAHEELDGLRGRGS